MNSQEYKNSVRYWQSAMQDALRDPVLSSGQANIIATHLVGIFGGRADAGIVRYATPRLIVDVRVRDGAWRYIICGSDFKEEREYAEREDTGLMKLANGLRASADEATAALRWLRRVRKFLLEPPCEEEEYEHE